MYRVRYLKLAGCLTMSPSPWQPHVTYAVTNVDDYLVRLIKGCVEMRLAPRMMNRVNMCPVDFVANAMVEISARPTAFGKCFHFVNPTTCVGDAGLA